MDARLIALKLFLDELQLHDNTSTIESRKLIQKAVYLGQCAGADLGYRFGWHKMGPYSADLARDYYLLSERLALGDRDYEGKMLQNAKRRKLKSVLPLMSPPAGIGLEQPDWLELLSSLHFMRTIQAYDESQSRGTLKKEKTRLNPLVDRAQAPNRE